MDTSSELSTVNFQIVLLNVVNGRMILISTGSILFQLLAMVTAMSIFIQFVTLIVKHAIKCIINIIVLLAILE